jgi:dodecin
MSDHVYKILEAVGTSKINMEDAINTAIAKVSQTENKIRWFQLVETRGQVEGSEVAYWQVTIKVGISSP